MSPPKRLVQLGTLRPLQPPVEVKSKPPHELGGFDCSGVVV